MAISTNYPAPVTVNGYICRNCTDVDRAKRFIDPAHPQDGPFGVNAKDKPGAATTAASRTTDAIRDPATLAALHASRAIAATPVAQGYAASTAGNATGTAINLLA